MANSSKKKAESREQRAEISEQKKESRAQREEIVEIGPCLARARSGDDHEGPITCLHRFPVWMPCVMINYPLLAQQDSRTAAFNIELVRIASAYISAPQKG
jgi:hypothetical protein